MLFSPTVWFLAAEQFFFARIAPGAKLLVFCFIRDESYWMDFCLLWNSPFENRRLHIKISSAKLHCVSCIHLNEDAQGWILSPCHCSEGWRPAACWVIASPGVRGLWVMYCSVVHQLMMTSPQPDHKSTTNVIQVLKQHIPRTHYSGLRPLELCVFCLARWSQIN